MIIITIIITLILTATTPTTTTTAFTMVRSAKKESCDTNLPRLLKANMLEADSPIETN